jgi:hypothetical protein
MTKKAAKQPDKTNESPASSEPTGGRQSNAPVCPNCSEPEEPVLCKSNRSDPFFTRYYCPNDCGFSVKVARPDLRKRVDQAAAAEDDFSAR